MIRWTIIWSRLGNSKTINFCQIKKWKITSISQLVPIQIKGQPIHLVNSITSKSIKRSMRASTRCPGNNTNCIPSSNPPNTRKMLIFPLQRQRLLWRWLSSYITHRMIEIKQTWWTLLGIVKIETILRKIWIAILDFRLVQGEPKTSSPNFNPDLKFNLNKSYTGLQELDTKVRTPWKNWAISQRLTGANTTSALTNLKRRPDPRKRFWRQP